MSDDHSADIHTAGSVDVGGSATGDIETRKDFDWFAVAFVAGAPTSSTSRATTPAGDPRQHRAAPPLRRRRQ